MNNLDDKRRRNLEGGFYTAKDKEEAMKRKT